MVWGYALVWPHQWMDRDEDPLMAKLLSLRDNGLTHCMSPVREWMDMPPPRRDRLMDFMAKHGVTVTLGIYTSYFGDRDAARRDLEAQTRAFLDLAPQIDAPIAHTGVVTTHRFAADPPLERQMETLAELLLPVAKECAAAGRPLAIENHGDYYCSDLASLCRSVPGLRIFLDTGNTYLIGEQPIPAFEVAAPYVAGGHFKDHVVSPNPEKLRFELGAATLGTGHVPLRECFEILQAKSPNPDRIAMQIELIPPSFVGNDNIDSFEQSVAFVRSLEASK